MDRRGGRGLALCAAVLGLTGAAPAPVAGDLTVNLSGVRNAKGVVHLCLTAQAARFLKCKEDKGAVAMTVPAAGVQQLSLTHVRPRNYALLIVHDENRNGKLDMTMGIPREGFGFSNNPAMKMRAPRFEEVRFAVQPGTQVQAIRLRYVL